MGILFTLLLGTLFVRPSEIVPDLAQVPIFYILIIGCMLVNLGPILARFSWKELVSEPTNLCVVVIFVGVFLSHATAFRTIEAREYTKEFGKTLLFYFTLVSAVRTPRALESMISWVSLFIIIAVSITVLQYKEFINLEGMDSVYENFTNWETGEVYRVRRICGTGLFGDPNDLSILLVIGMGLAVYKLQGGRDDRLKLFWLLPLSLYLYCLMLTQSRGGFLAMLTGMLVLFQAKYGWKKAIPYMLVGLPVAIVLFGGRQTSIDTQGGTGQDRIQLWAMGFAEMTRHPIFGTGYGTYPEIAGLVAHNSFVHAFVELGLFGGIAFVGAFWYVLWHLYKLKGREDEILEPGLRKLRPCLLAGTAGACLGMMTVSRCYIQPTYFLLGMGMCFLKIVDQEVPGAAPPMDRKTFKSLVQMSLLYLIVIYTYARFGARFGGG